MTAVERVLVALAAGVIAACLALTVDNIRSSTIGAAMWAGWAFGVTLLWLGGALRRRGRR